MNLRDAGQASLRVTISEECIVSGQCVISAPDLFELGVDGPSQYIAHGVAADRLDEIRMAIRGCPVEAIELVATGTVGGSRDLVESA